MGGYFGSTYFGQYWPGGIKTLGLGKINTAFVIRGVTAAGVGSVSFPVGHIPSTNVIRGANLTIVGQLLLGMIQGAQLIRGATLSGAGAATFSLGKIATSWRVKGVCLYHALVSAIVGETTLAATAVSEDTITLTQDTEGSLSLAAVNADSLTASSVSETTLTLTPEQEGTCE